MGLAGGGVELPECENCCSVGVPTRLSEACLEWEGDVLLALFADEPAQPLLDALLLCKDTEPGCPATVRIVFACAGREITEKPEVLRA